MQFISAIRHQIKGENVSKTNDVRMRQRKCGSISNCSRMQHQLIMINYLIDKGANIQVVLSAQDLRAFGLNLLSEYAAQEARKKEMEDAKEVYLTINQVCEMLHIDRSTLWRWQKEGYLSPINMMGRNRYSKAAITKIMEERK